MPERAPATGVLGLLVRRTLNPDGVSYLDLAEALRHGDWRHFVQGYRSPLYPTILAAVGAVTGHAANALVADAHLVNVVAVWATILVIWRWARAMTTTLVRPCRDRVTRPLQRGAAQG